MQSWGRQREVEKPKLGPQRSVSSLPEEQQAAVMADCDRAMEEHPSVLINQASHRLHVFEMGGGWEVWLNCADTDFTGVCLSAGKTRQVAVHQAMMVLLAALTEVQK